MNPRDSAEARDPKAVTFDQLYRDGLSGDAFLALYDRWQREQFRWIMGYNMDEHCNDEGDAE
jgi:hypothetical protein